MAILTFRDTMDEAGRIAQLIRPHMGRLPGTISVNNENCVDLQYVVPETVDLKALISALSVHRYPIIVRHAMESYFFTITITHLPF